MVQIICKLSFKTPENVSGVKVDTCRSLNVKDTYIDDNWLPIDKHDILPINDDFRILQSKYYTQWYTIVYLQNDARCYGFNWCFIHYSTVFERMVTERLTILIKLIGTG